MAGVRIESGPVEAHYQLRNVPVEKWADLVEARCDFLAVKLTHDCRCLVNFVKDAEQLWQPLGYANADDLIRRGYDLEPEEIRLAVRWLELNAPEEAVGLPEVLNKAQQMAGDDKVTPSGTHGGARDGAGRHAKEEEARESFSKMLDEAFQEATETTDGSRGGQGIQGNKVTLNSTPDRGNRAEYLVRRLKRDAPEIAEALARGEYPSARAAAIAAGIVKVPTPLDLLRRVWAKASPKERAEFLASINNDD